MAADLSLNPAGQPDHRSATGQWLWNSHRPDDDADSWEARAFAEDAGSILGATWPPRSYTCTFCRREFRSAQALGGHMNVHRRDRARLRQIEPNSFPAAAAPDLSPAAAASFPFSQRDFSTHAAAGAGGLCMLYTFPGAVGPTFFRPDNIAGCTDSQAALFPVSHHSVSNNAANPTVQFSSSALCFANTGIGCTNFTTRTGSSALIEELDLELRLGHNP